MGETWGCGRRLEKSLSLNDDEDCTDQWRGSVLSGRNECKSLKSLQRLSLLQHLNTWNRLPAFNAKLKNVIWPPSLWRLSLRNWRGRRRANPALLMWKTEPQGPERLGISPLPQRAKVRSLSHCPWKSIPLLHCFLNQIWAGSRLTGGSPCIRRGGRAVKSPRKDNWRTRQNSAWGQKEPKIHFKAKDKRDWSQIRGGIHGGVWRKDEGKWGFD